MPLLWRDRIVRDQLRAPLERQHDLRVAPHRFLQVQTRHDPLRLRHGHAQLLDVQHARVLLHQLIDLQLWEHLVELVGNPLQVLAVEPKHQLWIPDGKERRVCSRKDGLEPHQLHGNFVERSDQPRQRLDRHVGQLLRGIGHQRPQPVQVLDQLALGYVQLVGSDPRVELLLQFFPPVQVLLAHLVGELPRRGVQPVLQVVVHAVLERLLERRLFPPVAAVVRKLVRR